MRKVVLIAFICLSLPVVLLATWAEPSCDPTADPTTCNISAPINVSGTTQTKTGGLTLNGALITNSTITANSSITAAGTVTINSTGSLTVNGVSTFGAAVTINAATTINGTGVTINSPLVVNNGISVGATGNSTFNNPVTLSSTSRFTYSGTNTNFSITANSIDDSEVSDTLTASIFKGTGTTTNAVDLATSEVAGVLPSTSVTDVWVNTAGDTMTGTLTINPTTGRAIAIQPNTTSDGIWISGATGEALVSLNQTGNGRGIYLNTIAGVTGKGIEVVYAGSSYPVEIRATGSAPQSLHVENGTTNGYGVYSKAGGTNSTGVAGTGTLYGTVGASATGTGGFFITDAAGGTGLYATLNNAATTTTSKALEVVGKNGYGGYITVDGSSATGLYVENTNTAGTYSVGYFKANGASSSSGTTTALYAENTSTASSTTKYAIQAKATSPGGEGIYAVSDYGRAAHFESNSGGYGIYIDADGATYGIDIEASGTTAGIDIDAVGGDIGVNITVDDYDSAVEANGGDIKTTGGFRGGQFYANENAGNGIYKNVDPNYVFAEALGGSSFDAVNDLLFDGSSVWVARGGFTPSYLQQRGLSDGRSLAEYINSASWLDNGVALLADDQIYFFSDSANYDVINPLDGTTTSGSLSSSITIYSAAYDGEDIWFGSNNTVREWGNLSTLSTRLSSTGSMVDILFADGYIWAVDSTNDVVRKILPDSPYTATSITVGDNPQAAVYDGQYIWVANYTGNSLTRINTEDSSTTSYSVSSFGTGPQALTFDGVNIWIGYNSSGVGVFNVATESLTKENDIAGAEVKHLAFDGTYIWVVTSDQYIFKIPSGFGFGETAGGLTDGILMYNTSGSVRCLYVSGSTVTASSTLTNCQ